MFGEETLDDRIYGGRQGYFSQHASELLADPQIKSELERAYPGSTDSQKLAYLSNIVNKGCGFVAEVNSVFAHYEGREEDFREKFGFDMYQVDSNGKLSFNYQPLVLGYYDYVYSDKANKKIWQVNSSSSYMGVTATEHGLFGEFLKERYDVNSKQTTYYNTEDGRVCGTFGISDTVDGTWTRSSLVKGKDDVMSVYNEFMEEGHDAVIVGQRSGTSGHSMYVVGEEDGNLVLSDQGRKVNPAFGNCRYNFTVIDFED